MPKKLLLVAMPSSHFIRWVSNINNAGFEVYWFDILNRGYQEDLHNVNQITNWRKRKIPYIKGEYFLYKNLSLIYRFIEPLLQVTVEEKFKQLLEEIKPDLVHSFEMQSCSYPLYKIMKRNNIKWLYSCWGSDIYFYKNDKYHLRKIKQVLKRINFLHTDCMRDFNLGKENGFSACFFGKYPAGGGYDVDKQLTPFDERKIILIKGYEHDFGRAINVLKAINLIFDKLVNYEIIVFSAHKQVEDYISKNFNSFKLKVKILSIEKSLSSEEFIKLMGDSLIYIGNSISDGMPNTLLEALCFGAFPIQSNPGGVTEEVIKNNRNGLLIDDPEDINKISNLILHAVSNFTMMKEAFNYNTTYFKNKLGKSRMRLEIIDSYKRCLDN